MPGRNEEINELLSTVSKLNEMAARNQLTLVTQLLDMLQLELTMIMFGYSDVDDSSADDSSAKPIGRPRPASKRPGMRARARRV